MGAELQRAAQEDVMLLQFNQLPARPSLSPLELGQGRHAAWGEQQLSPPWEKHMTARRRNTETEGQKERECPRGP